MSTFADWPVAKVAEAIENDYSDSVMVCLKPPLDYRDRFSSLRVATEETDNLHITLLYLGTAEEAGGEIGRERLYRACYGAAMNYPREIKGKANGFGWFLNEDSHVLVALWDMPYLGEFRQRLLDQCALHDVPLRTEDHGFTPHMTLSHQDETNFKIPDLPTGGAEEVAFESFWLVWGENWQEIPFIR